MSTFVDLSPEETAKITFRFRLYLVYTYMGIAYFEVINKQNRAHDLAFDFKPFVCAVNCILLGAIDM